MKNFLKLSLLVAVLTGGVEMRGHEEPVDAPVAKAVPEKLSTFSSDEQAKRQAVIEQSVAKLGSDDHNKLIASSVNKILKMNNPDSGGLNLSDPAVTDIKKDTAGKITSVTFQHPATTFLQKTFSFPTPKTTITHNADGTHTAITTSSGLFGFFPKTTDPIIIHNSIKVDNSEDGSVYKKTVDDKTGEVHESINTVGAADAPDTLYERKTYPSKAVEEMFQDTGGFSSVHQTHPLGVTFTGEKYADGTAFDYHKNVDGSFIISHEDGKGTTTQEARNAQLELTNYKVIHKDATTKTEIVYGPDGSLKTHLTTDIPSKNNTLINIHSTAKNVGKFVYQDGDKDIGKPIIMSPLDPDLQKLKNLTPDQLPPAKLGKISQAKPVATS